MLQHIVKGKNKGKNKNDEDEYTPKTVADIHANLPLDVPEGYLTASGRYRNEPIFSTVEQPDAVGARRRNFHAERLAAYMNKWEEYKQLLKNVRANYKKDPELVAAVRATYREEMSKVRDALAGRIATTKQIARKVPMNSKQRDDKDIVASYKNNMQIYDGISLKEYKQAAKNHTLGELIAKNEPNTVLQTASPSERKSLLEDFNRAIKRLSPADRKTFNKLKGDDPLETEFLQEFYLAKRGLWPPYDYDYDN